MGELPKSVIQTFKFLATAHDYQEKQKWWLDTLHDGESAHVSTIWFLNHSVEPF